jgi:hypothetical protein
VEQKDRWTVAVPVSNLEFDHRGPQEFRVDRVVFVSARSFARKRRRFGLPWRLSDVRKDSYGVLDEFIAKAPVLAVARVTGTRDSRERETMNLLRDEIAIIAASQLGYAKRCLVSAPAIVGERPGTSEEVMWVGQSKAWTVEYRRSGPMGPLRLSKEWATFQKKAFLPRLLKILRGNIPVATAWRNDLRRAITLVGLSHMSNTASEALLYNVIALEVLLTKDDKADRAATALPSRASAFLGWSPNWKGDAFEEKIARAYQNRNLLVHRGDRTAATLEDVFTTDDVLLNLFVNVVAHPKVFGSKEAVVHYSRCVEAERLLGVPHRFRKLRMFRRTYTERDYRIY